jgi:hypothetical protein
MRAGMAHANSCDGDALTASPAVDRVSQSTLLFRAFSKTGRSPMLRQQGRDGHVPASSARTVLGDNLHRPSCALPIQRGLIAEYQTFRVATRSSAPVLGFTSQIVCFSHWGVLSAARPDSKRIGRPANLDGRERAFSRGSLGR